MFALANILAERAPFTEFRQILAKLNTCFQVVKSDFPSSILNTASVSYSSNIASLNDATFPLLECSYSLPSQYSEIYTPNNSCFSFANFAILLAYIFSVLYPSLESSVSTCVIFSSISLSLLVLLIYSLFIPIM